MRRVGLAGDALEGGGWPANDAHGRTVLVIGTDLELAVALRDRLDRAYVTVCEVRHDEAAAAVRACHPWPWMVVGSGADCAETVLRPLARRPALVFWRGARPAGLAAHTRGVALFSELAAAAEAAIAAEVGSISLAPGAGLTMPGGGHVTSAALEALVASHPRPLFAAPRHFAGVPATLAAHDAPLRVARTPGGGVALELRAA
jgi:hypothetical protein